MIAKEQVMPMLLRACPSFADRWQSYLADHEEGLLYVDLGEFAHHVIDLVGREATSELPHVFDVVERLHVEGDAYVKEAATIGLLEGLQNIAENAGLDPRRLEPWLRPESAKWWAQLNEFWAGKSPAAAIGRRPPQ